MTSQPLVSLFRIVFGRFTLFRWWQNTGFHRGSYKVNENKKEGERKVKKG
jgi:hypothetical protein